MRFIFLKKPCPKCGGGTNSRLFFKKSKLTISLDQQSEVSYSLFSLYVQVEDYQNILKLRFQQLALTSCKAFLKNKNRSGTSLPVSFST